VAAPTVTTEDRANAHASRRWLKPVIEPMRPLFHELVALSLFVNILALAVPVFVLQVYDRVVFHAGLTTLQGLVLGMTAVVAFDFVLRQARSRLLQRVALQIDVAVGRQLFDKVAALPLRVLEARPAAYWQALFRDVETVRNTFSGASAVLIADLPFILVFLGLIYIIAQPIVWVLAIALPAFLGLAVLSTLRLSGLNQRERRAGFERDALVAEIIAGRSTMRSLALHGAIRPSWDSRHAAAIRGALGRGSAADRYVNLGTSLGMLTTVMLTTAGAIAILGQELTIGALIAANILTARVVGPMNQLVGTWKNYAGYAQAAARLGQVFALADEDRGKTLQLDRPQGQVIVEDVTFRYAEDGPPVIEDLGLIIRPGGLHAIIGRNGSGKTTLLKLIQGLYRPVHGRILLDGADVAQFSREDAARWIGYVPQEGFLFAGTIQHNIVMGKPDASDEEVIRAARLGGVHEVIIDLPDGYATDIGEAGGRLSAGERQRIAIARALVGDPPVLLLDEPSGNLDRPAEERLRATLTELARDHNVIVVTHSPILISGCNNVIALDKGKLVAAGPAHQVLPGLFAAQGSKPNLQRKA
jgi:ATP-binding cassette subfamily C protein LapB